MWYLVKWLLGLGLLLVVVGGCTLRARWLVSADSHLVLTDQSDLTGSEK